MKDYKQNKIGWFETSKKYVKSKPTIPILVALTSILIILYLNRGTKVPIPEVFPHHFPNDTITNKPTNYLPKDILVAIPHDFQLANNLGYLTTYIYPEGEVWIDSKEGFLKSRNFESPSVLKKKYQELTKLGYNVYQPIQFPHILCAYPDIDLIDNFEKEASIDLLKSLIFIQNNDSTIAQLGVDINQVIDNISDASKEIAVLDGQITQKENEQRNWVSKIVSIDNSINKVKGDIANQQKVVAQLQNQSDNLHLASHTNEYYDLYSMLDVKDKPIILKNDILKPIHEKLAVDIRKKDYNTPRTSINGSPFLDKEMVEALDKLNDILKDPEGNLSKGVDFSKEEIAKLKEWKAIEMKIVSASRSATDQTKVANSKKAGTLDTKHIIGVAVDFDFQNKPYSHKLPNNSKNYKLFVKVAASVGLHFPLEGDLVEANHAVLATYQNSKFRNTAKYCQQLNAYLEGYYSNINNEISRQFEEIFSKKGLKNSTIDKLSNIENQVKDKQKKLNEVESAINDLKNKFSLKEQELAQLSNLFCSLVNREKELRNTIQQKERAIRNRERDHDHFHPDHDNKPQKEQPRDAPQPREKPQSERPQPKEKPQRPEPKPKDFGPKIEPRVLG